MSVWYAKPRVKGILKRVQDLGFTVQRNHEVDQGCLRGDLGLVVGVRELGLDVEHEARVVLHLLVPELDHQGAPWRLGCRV